MSGNDRTDENVPVGDDDSSEYDAPPARQFETLVEEVDEVGYQRLLEDPEYRAFVEDVGSFEMPDDEIGFEQLVALDAEDVDPEPQRDGGRSVERSAVVDDLIEELRGDGVTESQRSELREALGLADLKQIEIQLTHLKSRFFDLEAYVQAIESRFEPDRVDDLEAIRADLEALREEVDSHADHLESIHRGLVTLDRRQQRLGEDVESVEESVDGTRDALRRNLSIIERELERHREWRTRRRSAAGDSSSTGRSTDSSTTADAGPTSTTGTPEDSLTGDPTR